MTEENLDLRYLLVCYSWSKMGEWGYGNIDICVPKGKLYRKAISEFVEKLKKDLGLNTVIILSMIDLDGNGEE